MPVSRKNKKNKRSPSSQKSRKRQREKRRLKEYQISNKKYNDSLRAAAELFIFDELNLRKGFK